MQTDTSNDHENAINHLKEEWRTSIRFLYKKWLEAWDKNTKFFHKESHSHR